MPGQVIGTDRPCIRCGYNLRGLETNGACPECGTAITQAKKSVRLADNLTDAPLGYIRLMAVGLGLQAGLVLLIGFLTIFRGLGMPGEILKIVAAIGWAGSAWIVTAKRPRTERIVADEILDSAKIRLIARVTQSVGVLAAFVGFGAWYFNSPIVAAVGGVLMLGALFGLVPLGVYLSALADWAGDTNIGTRLRGSVWCIAVCGTVMVALVLVLQLPVPFALLLAMVVTISGILVAGGLIIFGFSVLQLAMAAGWAIQNAVQAREREIRLAEKRRRRAMRDAARAHAADAAMAATAPPPPEAYADDPSVIPLAGGDTGGSDGGSAGDGRPTGRGPGAVESRMEATIDPDDDSQMYALEPED